MKNYVSIGDNVPVTLAEDTPAGTLVVIGTLTGVTQSTGVAGDTVTAVRKGVFDLPKVAGQAWDAGVKVYWDAANSQATSTASGNKLVGCALESAANPSTTGRVLLDGVIR